MASVAEKAALSRETLYRTLSTRGNPTIKTLTAVLKAAGLAGKFNEAEVLVERSRFG